MKNVFKYISVAMLAVFTTSCIQEIDPKTDTVTIDQAAAAPGAFDNFVSSITSSLCGQFVYGGTGSTYPYDCGYPSFMIQRDVMGSDTAEPYLNWFSNWYQGQYGGPSTGYSQIPWTYYYGWIKSCNNVISVAGEEPTPDMYAGLGIAFTMRAFFYQDLAQMFAPRTYLQDKDAPTVPYVDEKIKIEDLAHNPRKTNAEIWDLILHDLDMAESYFTQANFKRSNVFVPDITVAYGLKARAYLIMGDWANAITYAQKAQQGYTALTPAEYTSRETGFNTPNSAWMFGCQYLPSDDNITYNDADSNWGSLRCLEIDPITSGCGYASNYGQLFIIDRHLYESIPLSDIRRNCYVDYAIDDLQETDSNGNLTPESAAAIDAALSAYSDYPSWVRNSGIVASDYGHVGGLSLKFRVTGGHEGHTNQYIGFCVAVPFMRVEEMQLIEIEAMGRQNEQAGIDALTNWVRTNRDPLYNHGRHNEAYGNTQTPAFINEVWWQRRVEFWGEGISTLDIKRLDKGIIRSYAGTSHAETARYNVGDYNHADGTIHPDWMNLCIVQTETNYNFDCTNNPTPVPPTGDSKEWEGSW